MAGPEHGPAKKRAGGHEAAAHKAHAEHKPHPEQKHESANKHQAAHTEWIGKKTKEALGAGGLTAYLSTALLMASGIVFPPYLIGLFGLIGMGTYAFGARNKATGGGGH